MRVVGWSDLPMGLLTPRKCSWWTPVEMWWHAVTQGVVVKGKLTIGVGSQYSSHYLGTRCIQHYTPVEMWWHAVTHGGKWRGNWRREWVASTLHTTSEHGVTSITIVDAHISAVSSSLNWRPPPNEMDSPVSPKDEIWFMRICHHISTGLYSFRIEAGSTHRVGRVP